MFPYKGVLFNHFRFRVERKPSPWEATSKSVRVSQHPTKAPASAVWGPAAAILSLAQMIQPAMPITLSPVFADCHGMKDLIIKTHDYDQTPFLLGCVPSSRSLPHHQLGFLCFSLLPILFADGPVSAVWKFPRCHPLFSPSHSGGVVVLLVLWAQCLWPPSPVFLLEQPLWRASGCC